MNESNPLALVVEDDDDLSVIFSESFKAAGFDTEIIRDGTLAIQRLAETVPDVVALDLHLPGVSGEKILDRICADERMAETQVVITTADPRMADLLQDRAVLVLIKPISFGQLRDLAKRLKPAR